MDQLFALVVAVPLLMAAALLAARPLLRHKERVRDLIAVAASVTVAVMLLVLVLRTSAGSGLLVRGLSSDGRRGGRHRLRGRTR